MAGAVRQKKCRVCKEPYAPARPMQVACSPDCALVLAKAAREKHSNREAVKERKETRERLKSRADWVREAQTAVNRYVRLRDHGRPCISCGATPGPKFGGAMDCGHYRSVGSSPGTRFDLRNMASQCVKCNRYLGGMAVEFRKGLVARIGVVAVEDLESYNSVRKFSIDYLRRLKSIFSKKARRLEKRIGIP